MNRPDDQAAEYFPPGADARPAELVQARAVLRLRTELAHGHWHLAVFNAQGDGVTSECEGHVHKVAQLRVQPAEDGHSHELVLP